MEVKEVVEGEEEEDEDDEVEEEGEEPEAVQKYRKITPNIQDHWIKLIPDQNSFIQVITKTFSEGLSAIKCFERWSKHVDLVDYSNALETWDDKVGDDWSENTQESTALDPWQWI